MKNIPTEHFQPYRIRQERPDGSIKSREILKPSEATLNEHHKMLRRLYGFNIPMPYATGSIPGMSLIDNVLPHRNNDHFYMLDLKDAFQSVDTTELIRHVNSPLIPEGDRLEVIDFILTWATTRQTPGLPLGAPCSPYLFNLYCLPMDKTIADYCDRRGITYTRYLDDLTFSWNEPFSEQRRKHLRERVEEGDHGLKINPLKSRHHSLANGPVTITGVSLQPDRRLQPAPHLLGAARKVFEDFNDILADDTTEVGRLHGWHGVLRDLATVETPTLRKLDRYYQQALGHTARAEYVSLFYDFEDEP